MTEILTGVFCGIEVITGAIFVLILVPPLALGFSMLFDTTQQ